MKHVTSIDQSLRQVARRVTHLVEWVDYYSGAGTQPSGCPARVTIFSTRPGGGDTAVEGLELLDRAA
jgi:hypothetical protein